MVSPFIHSILHLKFFKMKKQIQVGLPNAVLLTTGAAAIHVDCGQHAGA